MGGSEFIAVFRTRDTVQSGFIRSALEEAGVICYVDNENFSAVRMGGLGTMTVMVPRSQAERAGEIIRELGIV